MIDWSGVPDDVTHYKPAGFDEDGNEWQEMYLKHIGGRSFQWWPKDEKKYRDTFTFSREDCDQLAFDSLVSRDTEEHTGLSTGFPKQERYKDHEGEDWIDECARTFTKEEFRGAMKFTIGKYNRRLGRKDDITSEVTKIADYANRWLQYEQENQS